MLVAKLKDGKGHMKVAASNAELKTLVDGCCRQNSYPSVIRKLAAASFFLGWRTEIAPDRRSRRADARAQQTKCRLVSTSRQPTGGVAVSRLKETGWGVRENHS